MKPTFKECDQGKYWNILEEAASIAHDREADYGDVIKNFQEIKEVAKAMFNLDLTVEQICQMMIAMKVARQKNRHKDDNLIDCANYLAILLYLKRQ